MSGISFVRCEDFYAIGYLITTEREREILKNNRNLGEIPTLCHSNISIIKTHGFNIGGFIQRRFKINGNSYYLFSCSKKGDDTRIYNFPYYLILNNAIFIKEFFNNKVYVTDMDEVEKWIGE